MGLHDDEALDKIAIDRDFNGLLNLHFKLRARYEVTSACDRAVRMVAFVLLFAVAGMAAVTFTTVRKCTVQGETNAKP